MQAGTHYQCITLTRDDLVTSDNLGDVLNACAVLPTDFEGKFRNVKRAGGVIDQAWVDPIKQAVDYVRTNAKGGGLAVKGRMASKILTATLMRDGFLTGVMPDGRHVLCVDADRMGEIREMAVVDAWKSLAEDHLREVAASQNAAIDARQALLLESGDAIEGEAA